MAEMTKSHVDREIRKLAIELYEQALAREEHFDPEELAQLLIEELLRRFREVDRSIVDDLVESTARSAMREVDRERTRSDEQPSLIEDLDRPVAVGKSSRIARRHMRDADWVAHLDLVRANRARVVASAGREEIRYRALGGYLATGVTTERAIELWQADHPDEVLQ